MDEFLQLDQSIVAGTPSAPMQATTSSRPLHPPQASLHTAMHELPGGSLSRSSAVSNSAYDWTGTFPTTSLPPVTSSAVAPSINSGHTYRLITPLIQLTVDSWMELCIHRQKQAYRCKWANCTVDPLPKRPMRTHVQKHLGLTKLYECECGKQFASLESARRHSDSRIRRFQCDLCRKQFTRKDSRNVHRRTCTGGSIQSSV